MGINSPKSIYFFGETPIEGVSHLPLMNTHYLKPAITTLSSYDFAIITSKRAIKAMLHFDYNFSDLELYCVGKKTASFAQSKGLNVVYTSKGYAKDLSSEIKTLIDNKKGIYLRPKYVANEYITHHVKQGTIAEAICYETLCVDRSEAVLRHPAIFLFAAPSQISCFLKHFHFESNDTIIVIGQTTAEALPTGVSYTISQEKSLESLFQEAKNFISE